MDLSFKKDRIALGEAIDSINANEAERVSKMKSLRENAKGENGKIDINKLNVETNAIMHTGNTGKGEELVDKDVVQKTIIEMIPEHARVLPMLPSNHGIGMAYKETVPLLGEDPLFNGGDEKTSGAFAIIEGTTHTTDEVEIQQSQFVYRIDISRFLKTYAVEDVESKIRNLLVKGAARTVDAQIINADSVTAATGNVNSDDGAPDASSYYLKHDNGLRKLALTSATTKVDVGTLDKSDFISVMSKLGSFASDPSSLLWLFNIQTYLKAFGLDVLYDASLNGKDSVFETGKFGSLLGSDVMVARDMGLTEADGKISATPANNTLGQMACLYKPSVQYGFGDALNVKINDHGAQGVQLEAWFDFGFTIASQKANYADPSLALGYNVTV